MSNIHLSDVDLLLALDGELDAGSKRPVEAHLLACDSCRRRFHLLQRALTEADAVDLGDAALASGTRARDRVRLARALDDAAEGWQRSWTFRARSALAAVRIPAAVPAVLVLALLTIAALNSFSEFDRAHLGEWPRDQASLPRASLTPGAVAISAAADLCAGARPSRQVAEGVRRDVVRPYRMEHVDESRYELDALITPELGGSTDVRNLWPQLYESPVWNARVKDELEQLLPSLVCSGAVDLGRAQRDIAADWIAAYKKYFNTTKPLRAHLGTPAADDDGLEVVYAARVFAGPPQDSWQPILTGPMAMRRGGALLER
jgi:hypothetical protein